MILTTGRKEEDSKLARELGWLDATAIVVGSMIGSGIFLVSAESSRWGHPDGCWSPGRSRD
jgi:L-asparagine transporter-like permease